MNDQSRAEAIRDELYVLYREAEASGHQFLAYLLGMAVQEATELADGGDKEARQPAKRVA